MTRAIACCVVAAALAGCSGEGDDAPDRAAKPAQRGTTGDERVIRGWSAAVNAGRFEDAAALFAAGAIVEQGTVTTLDTRAHAIAFNRGLPCRADVTDVDPGAGSTLARFRLREGRGGGCAEGGAARVRFVIRAGRIHEWRQLPEPAAPPGQSA